MAKVCLRTTLSVDEPGLPAVITKPCKLAPVESTSHSINKEKTLGQLSDPTLDSHRKRAIGQVHLHPRSHKSGECPEWAQVELDILSAPKSPAEVPYFVSENCGGAPAPCSRAQWASQDPCIRFRQTPASRKGRAYLFAGVLDSPPTLCCRFPLNSSGFTACL